MRILFIRHGQMEIRASAASDPGAIDRLFNQEEQGHLTDRGRREAACVAKALRGEGVDAIYSSDLHRARETAEVAAEALGLELNVTPNIAEIRVGALKKGSRGARWVAGVTSSALPVRLKGILLSTTLTPLYFRQWRRARTEGGESSVEFDRRLGVFFDDLEEQHAPDATVAAVAHGFLITTLTLSAGPRAWLRVLRRPYIPNGAVCEMTLENGRLRSVRHADARHLQ